jgi:hypothetical protein
MQIHSVCIDLGKTTFHLVALGAAGNVLVRKKFHPGPMAKLNEHVVVTTRNLATGKPIHASSYPDTVGPDEAGWCASRSTEARFPAVSRPLR